MRLTTFPRRFDRIPRARSGRAALVLAALAPAALLFALVVPAGPAAPAAAPAPHPATPAPPPEAPPDGAIVRVRIETVVIDRGGTRSEGADEADLAPGVTGILAREVTLTGRDARRTREPVRVEARLTPEALPPGAGACTLRVELTTRRVAPDPSATAGGPLDHREAVVALAEGEERLVEAYASPATGGRIALKVQCAAARAASAGIPDLVTLDLEVERDAEGEPTELLRSQRLMAALGRDASTVIVANKTLPDGPDDEKRYRRERIEAVLSPVVLAAGRLQVEARISGDITTMSSTRPQSSAMFEKVETWIVGPGERRNFAIIVTPAGPDEGWSRLTLRVDVTARF